jgi:hypothetical protein
MNYDFSELFKFLALLGFLLFFILALLTTDKEKDKK